MDASYLTHLLVTAITLAAVLILIAQSMGDRIRSRDRDAPPRR
jgi:hypothetical protein